MGEAADVVRAAFNRANAGEPDGLAALCNEAVEFHAVPEIPGSTVYRGHDGIRNWLRTVREISDDRDLQIRGYYHGMDDDSVKQLLRDVEALHKDS